MASAKAEVFRRRLQKTPDYSPSLSEPMEILRRAEASLQDAEKRLLLVRKWQPLFHQAVLEYHGQYPANQGPGRLGRPPRGHRADPDDRRPGGVSASSPTVGTGTGGEPGARCETLQRPRRRQRERPRPNSRRSPSRSSKKSQPFAAEGEAITRGHAGGGSSSPGEEAEAQLDDEDEDEDRTGKSPRRLVSGRRRPVRPSFHESGGDNACPTQKS